MTSPEEIKAEYTSSLADLTFNSKPLINVLTMLAEENLPNAKIIVEAIEEHLAKVATDVKLPILYLIDCIVKNVGQTYTGLFSQNIVSTFCTVFKMVDEKTRLEMFKLRQTWNDVFPQMKLYAIDVQIHQIDPAWPVTAQPSNSIHLNPKFLKNTSTTTKAKIPAPTTDTAASVVPTLPNKSVSVPTDIDKETLLMQEQLIQKKKELLELQRKTLELEVLQTQVKLQEQMKAGVGPPISTNILLKPEVAKQLIPEAMTKSKPTGITNSMNQRLQNSQVKINPVSPALATSRPIRDPRLLRQQQQQQQRLNQQKLQQLQKPVTNQQEIASTPAVSTTSSVPAQKTAVLENNKNVTNKVGVRDISKDPRLSSKVDKKSKNSSKSRDQPSVPSDFGADNSASGQKSEKSEKSSRNSRSEFEKPSGSPSFNSSSSSSLASSSSSNTDSPSKSRRSSKHKKRDKPDTKRSQEFDMSSNKREKISKEDNHNYNDASKGASNDVSSFKSVKNKNRNYMRRNLTDSPVQLQDEDLRGIPLHVKPNRVQPADETIADIKSSESSVATAPGTKPMDVDLRQLPPPMSKKRTSTEASDQVPKKSKSFDVLFGSEDTDLRQLSVQSESERKTALTAVSPVVDRPRTPPPPIISAEKVEEKVEKPLPSSPKKSDLDAVRAKLANATSRDKVLGKSFHKNKLQQTSTTDQDLRPKVPPKITISPEEEKAIKSGHMTKEQHKQLLSKIFMQYEKDKLREAKIKDKEETYGGDTSLQAISDEEFTSDTEEKTELPPPPPLQSDKIALPATSQIPPPPMPFNDKDERLNIHHMATMGGMIPHPQNMETIPPGMDNNPSVSHHPQFYARGENRKPPFRGGRDSWRSRGRNVPLQGPQMRQPLKPWLHQQQPGPHHRWRTSGPFISQSRSDFVSMEDESSRSPGQDYGSQELTLHQEENKTLNIDGIPRDIRIYDETAVIFLNYDDPREISFQAGARRVIFNNKETYMLSFEDGYKECLVNGFPFRVKLGVPSRELFINDLGFECFFGGPSIHITVNGINMMVALDGPPPQVKISDENTDLVVGKINLIVNAKLMIPVFLDAKVQKFIVEGEPCTLQFVDALKRVLINDVPFNVEFGGLPKPCIIHGKKHFIRFSVLPKGVRPGFVKIRNMEGESGASPIRHDESSLDAVAGPLETEPLRPDVSNSRQTTGQESPDNRSNSPSFFSNMLQPALNNLDVLSNVLSESLTPAPTTGGYQVQIPGLGPAAAPQEGTASAQNTAIPKPLLNINELFQKLVASGFVKTQEKRDQEKNVAAAVPVSAPNVPHVVTSAASSLSNGKDSQLSKKPQEPVVSKPQKRTLLDILKPLTFARPETLKIRQAPLYSTLYTGMQCSSCGMRFPPEASMWYSQHLDWHFRQNRRGKKNARVANSRKWYYSLGDWKNYEELEDLEEREKNYFDQQQQQAEVTDDTEEETEIPTVPADPGTTNERCHVCRDAFDQFFNEEKEEWHLRNAIKMDDKTYHPVCYEDYQKSILDISLDDSKVQEEPQNKLIPGLEIVLDDDEDEAPGTPNEVVSLIDDDEDLKIPEDAPSPAKDEDLPEEDDGDDDDVILNEEAPIKIVVDDDDDDEQVQAQQNEDSSHSVTIKKERKPAFDDGFVDVGEIVTLNQVGQVKIKSEPVDDDEGQRVSLDTNEVSNTQGEETTTEHSTTEIMDTIQETSQPQPVTSHPQLVTSMDGNIELVSSAPSTVPTTISSGTKIKINISKPLPVITPKETNESSENSAVVKSSEFYMEEPEILRYKPALQNVPLKKLAPVQKGVELTGLCSIM